MPLSIDKLDILLSKNGMITSSFYIDKKDNCIMVEIYSVKNNETFILNISSKFKMKIGVGGNVFRIKKIQTNEEGSIIDRYSDKDSISTLEDNYNSTGVNIDHTMSTGNIEKNIEELYNRQVILVNNRNKYNSILRQFKRLSKCVSGTKYNICMMYKELCVTLSPDNTVKSFEILNDHDVTRKNVKLYMSVDLETLMDKVEHVSDDSCTIKRNINSTVNDSINRNIKLLKSTMSLTGEIQSKYNEVSSKLSGYISRIEGLTSKLSEITSKEDATTEKKVEVLNKIMTKSGRKLTVDIEYEKNRKSYDKKLYALDSSKREIIRNIISLKIKHDNLMLVLDSNTFDITVMSETIKNKINSLRTL